MGAIILDASKVNSYVLPNLTKSKNIILSACSINNALRNSLPNSFSYKNYISNIATQLYNIQKEIGNINQIITKKIEKAKSIESSGQNRTAAISRIASSIGAISGTVGGAMIGSTSGVAGAVIGATIGNKVGKTIGNTGAKIVGKTVSGIKKIGSSIVNGFKWIGSKVTKAYKSATSWISDKAKKVSNWVVEKFESAKKWTCKALKDTGAFISKTAKSVWSWIKNAGKTIGKHLKKIGASIANGVVALVKGVVSLVESLGDLIILIGSGIGTIGTALYDLGNGIATGNWNFDATKGLWKKTKSIVSYQWTNKVFDAFYETKVGKWLDSNAYKPFKSDGIACQILEGVGYAAGVMALTVLTFGVGGAAIGASTTVSAGTMAVTAAAVGFGKYTAEEWNKNSISINYNGTDMDIAIDYEKYSQIEKLKSGETTTISQQITLADGSVQEIKFYITAKGNGKYLITDSQGNVAKLNDLKESSTVKGLAIGGLKSAWEGAQWYVGGKINGLFKGANSAISNKILGNITRVGLDSLTGAVEVPFQSFVTMLSEGKSWSEAWDANGGWDAVKKQAVIGAIASEFGEGIDIITGSVASKKIVSALENSNEKTDTIIAKQLSKLSDLDVKKLLDSMDDASKVKVLKNMDPKRLAEFSKMYGGVNSKNQLKSADMAFGDRETVDFGSFRNNNLNQETISSIDMDRFKNVFEICKNKFGEDETIARLKAIVDPKSSRYGDFSLITRTDGAREILSNYTPNQINRMLENLKTNISPKTNLAGIHQFYNKLDQYGVDQADVENLCVYIYDGKMYSYRQAKKVVNNAVEKNLPVPKFTKKATPEYFKLKNKLINKGFTNVEASVILSSINDAGACSYASVCNEIFYQFRDVPNLFEEKFGYPMYKIVNGKTTLNSSELLVDLYTFANDTKNGGKFITNGGINSQYLSDTIDVYGRNILESKEQIYMSSSRGKNADVVDKFLKSKSPDLEFKSNIFINNNYDKVIYSDQAVNNIVKQLNEEIESGKSVSMGIYYNKKNNDKVIRMLSYDEASYSSMRTDSWKEGFGHSVTVTGTTNEGICVSSWGKMYLIPYEDLFQGGRFIITIENIKNAIGG